MKGLITTIFVFLILILLMPYPKITPIKEYSIKTEEGKELGFYKLKKEWRPFYKEIMENWP